MYITSTKQLTTKSVETIKFIFQQYYMMKAEVTYISEMFFEKTIFEEHDSVLVFEIVTEGL